MRLLPTFLTAVAGTTIAAFTAQQEPAQTPRTNPPVETARAGTNPNDGILAAWLIVDLRNGIEVSQMAQQRAQDPEVKQFAQKVAEEHRQLVQKLEPFAASRTGAIEAGTPRDTRPADPARPNDPNRPTDPDRPTDGTRPAGTPADAGSPRPVPGAHAGGGIDHVALIEELGAQCLSSARAELEKKTGAEFDHCFVGMAIGGHMKANDMMTVFQRHASSGLKTAINEGQKAIAMHLEMAKDIAEKMKTDVQDARRPPAERESGG